MNNINLRIDIKTRITNLINKLFEKIPPSNIRKEELERMKTTFTDKFFNWIETKEQIPTNWKAYAFFFYWYYLSIKCITFIPIESYLGKVEENFDIKIPKTSFSYLEEASHVFQAVRCTLNERVIKFINSFYQKYSEFSLIPIELLEYLRNFIREADLTFITRARYDALAFLVVLSLLIGIRPPTQVYLAEKEGISTVTLRNKIKRIRETFPSNFSIIIDSFKGREQLQIITKIADIPEKHRTEEELEVESKPISEIIEERSNLYESKIMKHLGHSFTDELIEISDSFIMKRQNIKEHYTSKRDKKIKELSKNYSVLIDDIKKNYLEEIKRIKEAIRTETNEKRDSLNKDKVKLKEYFEKKINKNINKLNKVMEQEKKKLNKQKEEAKIREITRITQIYQDLDLDDKDQELKKTIISKDDPKLTKEKLQNFIKILNSSEKKLIYILITKQISKSNFSKKLYYNSHTENFIYLLLDAEFSYTIHPIIEYLLKTTFSQNLITIELNQEYDKTLDYTLNLIKLQILQYEKFYHVIFSGNYQENGFLFIEIYITK
ncbi:MAG: hypothetical protein GF317_05750 [Candidatus Lokiarchaeota archaeon]|nr:hypothetical protein [Candidatus Lokiarchaeota archaeon]